MVRRLPSFSKELLVKNDTRTEKSADYHPPPTGEGVLNTTSASHARHPRTTQTCLPCRHPTLAARLAHHMSRFNSLPCQHPTLAARLAHHMSRFNSLPCRHPSRDITRRLRLTQCRPTSPSIPYGIAKIGQAELVLSLPKGRDSLGIRPVANPSVTVSCFDNVNRWFGVEAPTVWMVRNGRDWRLWISLQSRKESRRSLTQAAL